MRTFGGTGLQVSRYCLGAMMFGKMGNTDHGECEKIVHAALDAGINFIDTAPLCAPAPHPWRFRRRSTQ